MANMLKSLATWPRLVLSGLFWGAACGVLAAFLFLLLMISGGVAEGGFYWGGVYDFVMGVLVYSLMGCIVGAIVGGVLGTLTGGVAGVLMMLLLRLVGPYAAAGTTVLLVTALQVVVALGLVSEGDGTWFVLPVFAVIPLTIAVLRVAKDWVDPATAEHRRDTLAA